ncbi:MAG: ABC transporter permease, partial [Planctomycetota bacterium]
FKSGIFEQDLQWIYMPLPAAKEFLELYDGELEDYRIGGISVRLDDYTHAPAVKATIQEEVVQGLPSPGCEVLTWEDQRATLLRAVGVEKRIITVMMMLLVVFAGVVIFLILTLMGIEKTRDLGVLRSLGATGRGVVGLFLLQGMVLCAVGTILGIVAGWGLTANLNAVHDWITSVTGWRLFPSDVYYLSKIPTRMMWNDWAVILGPAVLFGFLGSIIPAVWAARQDPILALRHE